MPQKQPKPTSEWDGSCVSGTADAEGSPSCCCWACMNKEHRPFPHHHSAVSRLAMKLWFKAQKSTNKMIFYLKEFCIHHILLWKTQA